MTTDYLIFALIALAIWFWWSSTRSRERAIQLARTACQRCRVQLLDETVSVSKIRLRRNGRGHMGLERWYRFEFSTNGIDRRDGIVGVLGTQLTDMHLDLDANEISH